MIKRLAYYIVFKDLTNKGGLLIGLYDAVHGKRTVMHGIATVMEIIAINVSEKTYEEFSDRFTSNMIMSEDKAHV